MIFDLDGTLIDTLADIGESMNEVLQARGHPPHPLDAYRRFVGEGVALLAERALPPGARDAVSVEECVAAMRTVYGGRWDRRSRPYPGIEPLLAVLQAAAMPLAVLSNKPDDLTRLVIGSLLSDTPFVVVAGARAGVPRKPDPSAAVAIAGALGLAPSRIAYVGDTATDMHTARAAGMLAVGAAWGFREAGELHAAGADTVVARPQDVARVLGLDVPDDLAGGGR